MGAGYRFDSGGTPITDLAGLPVRQMGGTYALAKNDTIAANAGGNAVSGIAGGIYVLTVQFSGTSVNLQALGPDGVTYMDVVQFLAPGSQEVRVGANAMLRMSNPNGAQVTGVYASLT